MQESVIATFNDVQFIQGVTPMTQANWQKYFGTTLKSGIYSGFNMGKKTDAMVPNTVYDGVAIANGIRAEIKTDLGYTVVRLPAWEGDPDLFICLRIHFLSETAELISKQDIMQQEYAGQTRNEMLLRTLLEFEMDESYMCTRNDQYYDIPLFYCAGQHTWLRYGRDLRRIINKDPIYTLNPYEFEILGDDMTHRLLSGSNYYSVNKTKEITTFYPDVVDVTKMAVLTFDVGSTTQEIRLSKIPFVNNFLVGSPDDWTDPTPEGIWDRWKIKYIFSTEDWTEYPDYYSYSKVAGDKKVFRISFRGASKEGTSPNTDYNFNFFVEEIYNYQTTSWGAIGGNITDQVDLKTTLDNLESSTSDISETLATKAPIASPAFTGTPTAPTPTSGDNSTKLATTAFVSSAVSSKASLASPAFTGTPTAPTPTSGDNSTKLATTEFVSSAVSFKAPLASPAFTGTPTAPTPASGDNSTRLATTAFVSSAIGKASTDVITAYVGVTGKTPYFDTLQDAVDYIPNNGNIYVNPGMNCGSVSISGKICYIQPYNSTTNPAIISELTVTNSSYVQISNIDFVTDDVNLIYVGRGSTLVLSAPDGDIRFISNCSGTQSPGNFMIRVLQGSKLVTDDDLDFRMSVNDGNHYLIKAEDGSIVTFSRYSTNRDWSATELTDFWSQGSIIIYGQCTSSIYGSLLRTNGGQIFKS